MTTLFERLKRRLAGPEKKHYVHALRWYWGGPISHGPYRWRWRAKWKAQGVLIKYPYGCATVTDNPEPPPIVFE